MSDRKRFSKPTELSGIVSSALKRHGFQRQVASAMIVQKLRIELPKMIEEHMLNDVLIVSFANGNITIACKHSSASHMMTSKRAEIKNFVETNFPTITIKNIYCNVRPQDFADGVI